MSLRSWLQNLRSALAPGRDQPPDERRSSPRAGRRRPSVEVLEDRLTPSLYLGDYDPWVAWAPPPPVLADFTSDGIPDQLSIEGLRPGRGDGTFGDAIPTFAAVGDVLAAADFNSDARLDLVTAYSDWEARGAIVDVFLGRGDGTFHWVQSQYIYGLGFPTQIGVAQGGLRVTVAGYNEQQTEYVAVTLHNDGNWPPLPRSLRIGDVTVAEGNSGSVAATFTVTLSPGSTEPVTVSYSTGNAATAGSDFQAANGTLTFAPGEMSKTVTVLVNGDRVAEPNETFVVNLSSPTNATIADGQGVGTILDDEPRISIGDVSKTEGKKGTTTLFTFTFYLSAPYDQPVTVSFRTTDGAARKSDKDYVARTGTLTFAPGETTKTITIEVRGDSKRESDEYFYLDLFGNSTNSWFARNRGVGTILNDD